MSTKLKTIYDMALYRKSLLIPENVKRGIERSIEESSGEPRGRKIFSNDSKSEVIGQKLILLMIQN